MVLDDSRDRSKSPRGRGRPRTVREHVPFYQAYLSENPSKAAAEKFNVVFSAIWIVVFGGIVTTKTYLKFGDVHYMILGLFVALPYVLWPIFFPFKEDRNLHWTQRYFVTSNVWIAVLSYVGNYFWTHYFYSVLGASYSFPVKVMLNRVPFFLYLVTHGYFMFYHTATTLLLRLLARSRFSSYVAWSLAVFALAVVTAFMETWTISNVPYYSYPDSFSMLTKGSLFYGIYFYVSFPMFFRVSEHSNWTVRQALSDSLAACMVVTILLDLARLALEHATSLPWLLK